MNYLRPVHLIQYRLNHKLPDLLKITKEPCSTKVKQSKQIESNETPNKPPKRLIRQFKDPSILELFHRNYLRQSSTHDILHFYLATESTTPNKIAKHLVNLPDLSIPFVETNPGPGLLTNLLIQSEMNDLRLFESRRTFWTYLKDTYANIHPDRIKLRHADLFNNCVDNNFNKEKVSETLDGLPVTKWEDDISFRVYGATGCVDFFRNLIKSIVFQDGIMSHGRCELYMVIHAFTFIQLTSVSSKTGYFFYRTTSILFQLFFEYEVLDQFPSNDFLPQIGRNCCRKLLNKKKIGHVNLEAMYFVKIVPRKNLFQLCPEKYIQELWYFIHVHCISRTTRIIPSLEKLIPFSGPRLLLNTKKSVRPQPINEMNLSGISSDMSSITSPSMTLSNEDYYDGLNIYTQFGELTPSQLLTLFHQFRSLPDYSSSAFLPSLENMLLKKKAIPYESSDIETDNAENNLDDDLTDHEDVVESKKSKKVK